MSGCLFGLFEGLLLSGVTSAGVRAPGHALQAKFMRLGNMAGKTMSEICSAVGPPSSISQIGAGKTLLQWMAPGYHIAIRFDGDLFDGVTHEFAS